MSGTLLTKKKLHRFTGTTQVNVQRLPAANWKDRFSTDGKTVDQSRDRGELRQRAMTRKNNELNKSDKSVVEQEKMLFISPQNKVHTYTHTHTRPCK